MKLARQTTSSSDARTSELLRGRKHHFLIENATAAELAAMDDLLRETGFAAACDARPNYEEGCSCGWMINPAEVPAFKAEYKRLKGLVAERIEQNKAEAVAKALAAMTDDQVQTLANVAYNVRTELLTEHTTVNSLRNPDYCAPAANPFHRGRNVLTADLWALVAQCLIIGKNETCASLHLLEKKAVAEVSRRREAAAAESTPKTTIVNGDAHQLQLTFRLSDEVTQRRTVDAAHAAALIENDDFDGIIHDGLTDEQRAIHNRRAGIDIYGEGFKAMLDAAHAEARIIDRLIGNADLLPEYAHKYGMKPALMGYILELNKRLCPELLAADIEAAHVAALEEVKPRRLAARTGFTVEQCRVELIAEEGNFLEARCNLLAIVAEAHTEALAVNSALDDSLPEFSTPALQRFWPAHKAGLKMLIINAAHAAALVEDDERDAALVDFLFNDNSGAIAEPELTPEQLAVEKFCDERGSQYPGMSDIKREGSKVFHLKEDQWLKLYDGEHAEQVVGMLELFCKQEEEAAHAQQRAEIAAERANEERLQGFYHGGMDGDYPTDWDRR